VNRGPQVVLAAAFCAFGWLSSFTYPLQLLGPYLHDCSGGSTLPYVVSMVVGPATLALSAMMLTIGAGLGVRARWPWPLHLASLAVGAAVLPGYLVDTSVDGQFICVANQRGGPVGHPTEAWQRAYAPIQNAAMVFFGVFLLWYCRRVPRGANARTPTP
jgi:hypothetical protein